MTDFECRCPRCEGLEPEEEDYRPPPKSPSLLVFLQEETALDAMVEQIIFVSDTDCDCEFEHEIGPLERDDPDAEDGPWHFRRECACGGTFFSLHCRHDGVQTLTTCKDCGASNKKEE